MSQICAVLDCCSCCSVLKEIVKLLSRGGDQKVVGNIWGERCIARLDVFDRFCDLLPAILRAIEKKLLMQNIVETTQKKQNRYLWALVSFKLL